MIFGKIDIVFKGKSYDYNDYIKFKETNESALEGKSRVIVFMKRTPELFFLLAMLFEKGITFITVDPDFPEERIDHIISNSEADGFFSDIRQIDLAKAEAKREKDNIAYIIYTSGSTGKPKGVEVIREGLLSFIEGVSEVIDFSHGKRIACLTTVSFDIFFLESLMAMYKGLTVILASEDEQRNPKLMARLIEENNVDMVQMTPSRVQLLANHDKELACLKNVKEIMIGGEPFPLKLLKTLQDKTKAKIYNMYGPTETTIWSSISELTDKDRIDIGRPIKGTQIYILDETHRIVPDGHFGEIGIAGEGLAKGYCNKEDLTSERFIYLPEKPDVRTYLTGDTGRYLPDGNLECMGRIDNQVKIRGYRIELEEIEAVMMQHNCIDKAVAAAVDNGDRKALVAFYLSGVSVPEEDIKSFLSAKLPEYMIPAKYFHLSELPYTNNDKVDRKRLLSGYLPAAAEAEAQAACVSNTSGLSETESKIICIISDFVDVSYKDKVSTDADFTSLGIDSIAYVKIVVAIESEFDFEFDDTMIMLSSIPTVGLMLEYVSSRLA